MTHPGICRALARSFVWWPKLDSDLEEKMKRCTDCQTLRKNTPRSTATPMGVAKQAVVESTCRLCQTVSRKNVLDIN